MFHQALLYALGSSSKVVVEERVEPRADVVGILRSPAGRGPPPFLGDLTAAEAEHTSTSVSQEPPADAIERIGGRALLGGASIFASGGLFLLGESSRDEQGIARLRIAKKLLSF
uniref:Uncharacterized protein n=1 Tax=Noctiluca scintillans TaxID=2966 RepID=A0A7S0ZP21_NOCSC|mmetsp:Transcript_12803/g.35382  ORF Transcript_12803/g.35382 Transcript_12803/m.35382 type:complete len:114 (+) Transcript_12803:262-603(+)